MWSPLEQFNIKEIIKIEIINNTIGLITDIGIYIIIGIILIIIMEKEGKEIRMSKKIVIKEIKKDIIEKIIRTIVGTDNGKEKYMIILKVILIYILMYNIIGLVPYNKTITSELILTMTISISLVIGITIIGIEKNGIKILKILIPQNTPILLVPLLIIIETISYIARGLSLGLRLGANMIAGHTLLKIIITFIYTILNMNFNKYINISELTIIKYIFNINSNNESIENIKNIITIGNYIKINYGILIKCLITIIPLIGLLLIILLEIGVGIMQALVFVIITGIYISDVDYHIH